MASVLMIMRGVMVLKSVMMAVMRMTVLRVPLVSIDIIIIILTIVTSVSKSQILCINTRRLSIFHILFSGNFAYSWRNNMVHVYANFPLDCSFLQWECDDGQCIPADYRCDGGTPDCTDGSDENGCGEFTCSMPVYWPWSHVLSYLL